MRARVARISGLVFFFAFLAFFYLKPASLDLLHGRKDIMLGDGSDMAALPFQYGILVETLRKHWTWLFYGAVHTFQLNPPNGFLIWFTWIEKILVSFLSPFLPVEEMATAVGWILLVLNGLAFYAFGRTLQWSRAVCVGLGVAWAFNAFTRARASVHLAMAGTFFLPLAFAGAYFLFRRSTPRHRALAALCFLGAVVCQQYFTVCLILLTPLLLLYGYLVGDKKRLRDFRLPDALAALAPVIFLVWNLAMPAPERFLNRGTVTEPPPTAVELFMEVYGAAPIDYLGFDPKHGTDDWNPLRRRINETIEANLGQSNAHEHSHGIRWSLLLIAAWALAESFRRRPRLELSLKERRLIWLFAVVAALGFFTSLSPSRLSLFGIRWSPFLLINRVFPQFRVPCRFSVCVQFAVIAICGIYLSRLYGKLEKKKSKRIWLRAFGFALPALMIADYPPMLPVRTYTVLAPVTAAERGPGQCGTGLYAPYFSGLSSEITLYYFSMQILRNTDCRIINQPIGDDWNQAMLRFFSIQTFRDGLASARTLRAYQDNLVSFARCSRLDWIYFRREIEDTKWREETCRKLGWEMVSPRFCRSREPVNRFSGDGNCFFALR